MQVHIKELDINMDLGNNGITLGIANTKGDHQGNLQIGKAKIKWYKGKTTKNPVEIDWDNFVDYLNSKKD